MRMYNSKLGEENSDRTWFYQAWGRSEAEEFATHFLSRKDYRELLEYDTLNQIVALISEDLGIELERA